MKFRPSHLLLALAMALFGAGCASSVPAARPWRTRFSSRLVTLPAKSIADYLVIEAKWDKYGPYRFIVDTGSTVTLVSQELATRHPGRPLVPLQNAAEVKVRSAGGSLVSLPSTELRSIELDGAIFENVPALIFDTGPLSAHLGVKIDGILGFPLFRDTILTLDYPRQRVLLAPADSTALLPGTTIEFNNSRKTPVIPIGIGDASVFVLVDSGSDGALTLNPAAAQPAFAVPPREGPLVGTLTGRHSQPIGRLASTVRLGAFQLDRPVVELTDELSSIGGGVLKNFTVTFNQMHNRVTFHREAPGPVVFPPRRSVGISFSKEGGYWRVLGVVPDSPAASASVQVGELVTRINGEQVDQWNLSRLEQAVAASDSLLLTFINGTRETEKRLPVFDLVP